MIFSSGSADLHAEISFDGRDCTTGWEKEQNDRESEP